MNRRTGVLLHVTLALASFYCIAQTTPAIPTKPAPSNSASSATLPSEATFNQFLKKMFGWNADLTWKIIEIKPSEAAGISEAIVVFSTPQGQQAQKIYVTSDQKHAFTGEFMPFGDDPFAEARQILKD